MIKKHRFLFLILLLTTCIFSQDINTLRLSKSSEISIITSGPGDVLYEKFGHTAIRIKDPELQFDLIYNYGIFDFDNPTFYADFTKGYMKYKLAKYPFYYALKDAQKDKRWVKEQILNLNQAQKNQFFVFLENNAKPKNAGYLYDPFFDNCATKPRDIIQQILGENFLITDEFIDKKVSIRTLMNYEINQNTWGSLGINIALGSKLDKIATANQYLFLPDYLFKSLTTSKVLKNGKEENLVLKATTLLDFEEKKSESNTVNPLLVLILISIIGLLITYKDYKNKRRTKWLDFILFFITGLFGVLIIYLWFFTNHSTAPNNFNFLWAFAINCIISFMLLKESTPKWITKYLQFLLILLLIIPFVWLTKIQVFSYTLMPFFILLAVRYWFLQKTLNR